ncbi:hypothetical protein EYF80_043802 [Liparis tanakae]|uniref:Uncharacterized protein n=1 Tax=Liparis tanakae TaxID=230148 RepID=A0A4Z2FZ68_9TELE|nr:hypothetical protein EYF80_043802 [Liparis tanakae]
MAVVIGLMTQPQTSSRGRQRLQHSQSPEVHSSSPQELLLAAAAAGGWVQTAMLVLTGTRSIISMDHNLKLYTEPQKKKKKKKSPTSWGRSSGRSGGRGFGDSGQVLVPASIGALVQLVDVLHRRLSTVELQAGGGGPEPG